MTTAQTPAGEPQLEPCPKCHHKRVKAEMFEDHMNMSCARIETENGPMYIDWANEFWIVYCYSKKCDGTTATEPHATREEAIVAWNAGRLSEQEATNE